MKSLLIRELTENFVEESFLNTIRPDVLRIRQQFKEYAIKLKPELGKIVINHFNERLARANDTLMLGEYAPFILGNLFGISESSISKVAFPWFLMYEYSLLLDDLLDKERENWQLELLSSQVLLDNSHREFFYNIKNEISILDSFDKYRNQSIDSIIHELKWSKMSSIECVDSAVIIQGRKAALVKFCVSYMIHIDKNREITNEEESILDNICAGIQLLDDLTDFMEDYNEGRINIMLSSIYNWIETNYPECNRDNLSSDQLIAGLILSQNLNTTLEFSHFLLKSVNMLTINNYKNNGSIEYFNELADNCSQKGLLVDNILKVHANNISIFKRNIFQKEIDESYANSEEKEAMINIFLDILSFTPKSSN